MHVRLRNHFLTKLHLIWGLYVAILTLKKLYRAENQINCLKKALSVKKKKKGERQYNVYIRSPLTIFNVF